MVFLITFISVASIKKNKIKLKNYLKIYHHLRDQLFFFISPNKLDKRIDDIKEFFFNRDIVICREITKYHEEYIRTSVKKLSNVNFSRKGEISVVISEAKKERVSFIELQESDKKKINKLIKKMSIKDIVKKVSEDREISKKLIYKYCLEIKNEN